MSRARTSLKWIALVAIVALATVSLSAQKGASRIDAREAAKSYRIQAALAAIDADRAAAVNKFVAEWTGYVDQNVYDLQAEIGEAALNAPAWQIYGASLVGDLDLALRILGGSEPAGKYINALDAPQQKTWQSGERRPGPYAWGSSTDSLVYFPIPPCRMVDTRGSGARTGILVPGVTRTFDLTTTGYAKGQGGAISGCTGLPSISPAAWAVNVAVTGYTGGAGWLTSWPWNTLEPPNAAIINYQSSPYALSTGQTLSGTYNLADDIYVKAYVAPTHVIIDVMGYYYRAPGAASTVTRIAGTTTSVPAGERMYVDGGVCPAGTTMLSGEVGHDSFDVAIGENRQLTATMWTAWIINNESFATSVTVYSRCADTPVRIW